MHYFHDSGSQFAHNPRNRTQLIRAMIYRFPRSSKQLSAQGLIGQRKSLYAPSLETPTVREEISPSKGD